jgi:hypothetical protein
MSLIQDIKDIQSAFDGLKNKAEKQQRLYFNVISSVARLHQEYRIAKNYEISDQLRKLLNDNGIKIIQGTKQYGTYDNIPLNMRSNTVDDRWEMMMYNAELTGVPPTDSTKGG